MVRLRQIEYSMFAGLLCLSSDERRDTVELYLWRLPENPVTMVTEYVSAVRSFVPRPALPGEVSDMKLAPHSLLIASTGTETLYET